MGHPDGRHSAPLAWAVSLPSNTTGASGHSELTQIARATTAVIGMRIYLRELGQGHLVAKPTEVHTDAQVVLDGTRCRRVSYASKWICTRYAMVRQAGCRAHDKCLFSSFGFLECAFLGSLCPIGFEPRGFSLSPS